MNKANIGGILIEGSSDIKLDGSTVSVSYDSGTTESVFGAKVVNSKNISAVDVEINLNDIRTNCLNELETLLNTLQVKNAVQENNKQEAIKLINEVKHETNDDLNKVKVFKLIEKLNSIGDLSEKIISYLPMLLEIFK